MKGDTMSEEKTQEVEVRLDARLFLAWVSGGVLYVQGVTESGKKLPLPIGEWVGELVDLGLAEPYTDEQVRQAAVTAVEFITGLFDH
jgi:hypothetical protein